jgi:hypothetical protein
MNRLTPIVVATIVTERQREATAARRARAMARHGRAGMVDALRLRRRGRSAGAVASQG